MVGKNLVMYSNKLILFNFSVLIFFSFSGAVVYGITDNIPSFLLWMLPVGLCNKSYKTGEYAVKLSFKLRVVMILLLLGLSIGLS